MRICALRNSDKCAYMRETKCTLILSLRLRPKNKPYSLYAKSTMRVSYWTVAVLLQFCDEPIVVHNIRCFLLWLSV